MMQNDAMDKDCKNNSCQYGQDDWNWYSFSVFHFLVAFKILCNCLADLKPHLDAIYSMVKSGLLSIVLANSNRSWVRYSSMVVPVFSLKIRLRFLGLMATSEARSSIEFSLER